MRSSRKLVVVNQATKEHNKNIVKSFALENLRVRAFSHGPRESFRKIRMKSFAAVLVALLFAPLGLHAAAASDITISSPWLRATPKNASVAGGYATITNRGTTPDRLLGGSLPMAPEGQLHSMSMADGVMHMERLAKGLAIAPGATVSLTPGGYHLMFQKPKTQLKEGDIVQGSLIFQHAGKVAVTFPVAGLGAKAAPGAPASHDMGDMPGMDMKGK